MSLASTCPYPDCGQEGGLYSDKACKCKYKQPIAYCGLCNASNRVGARYCRACRNELFSQESSVRGALQAGEVSMLGIRGSFRRLPVVANGFIYALSKEGLLFELSSRANAKEKEIVRLALSSAGFNRFAIVDIAGERSALRGWTFLAASPEGVEAVSIASRKITRMYEPQASEQIAANRSEADATGFKGLVATCEFVAFVVASTPSEHRLTILYLKDEQPNEHPLTLEGTSVAGPALFGHHIVYCTDKQLGVYIQDSKEAYLFDLPTGFKSMLTPSSVDFVVPPGGTPFIVELTHQGHTSVHVAGSLDGCIGLLKLDLLRAGVSQDKKVFREIPRGSSLNTNPDGSVCLSMLDRIEVYRNAKSEEFQGRMQSGMPTSYHSPYLCSFNEADFAGQHRIRLIRGAQIAEVRFDDSRCNKESTGGVCVVNGDVIVPYLDVDADDECEGLIFARCTLTDTS